MTSTSGSTARWKTQGSLIVARSRASMYASISAFLHSGKFQDALLLYEETRAGVSARIDRHSYVALLKACAKLKDPDRGLQIYSDVVKMGLVEEDLFVGSAVVNMYAKFGSLVRAQEVFDKLPIRNVVSWNSLMASYAHRGHGKEALTCFDEMQQEGISPNSVSFLCTLKACTIIEDLETGHMMHAYIERKGFLIKDLPLCNSLLDMYAKCGSLSSAQNVFDKLRCKDTVTWNVLISGYAENGCIECALAYFEEMQCGHVSPDSITLSFILKACGCVGAAHLGREIHAKAEGTGLLAKQNSIGKALIDMYVKCGFFPKAQQVFDTLLLRDVFIWNSLIAGYAENGCAEEALECFEHMKLEGVPADYVTYLSIMKACISLGDVEKISELHIDIEKLGLLSNNPFLGSTLVDTYAKCGCMAKAQQVFDKLERRNVVSWTVLITGYAVHGYGEKTLECFQQMQLEGIPPNGLTFVAMLRSCTDTGAIDKGQELHVMIDRMGLFSSNTILGSAIVDMYAKHRLLHKAQETFNDLPFRDVIAWTAIIAGYVENGQGEEALKCFEQMQLDSVPPDAIAYICGLKACCIAGATNKGLELHLEIEKKGLLENDIIQKSLVDMYARFGSLVDAQLLFDKIKVKDITSWNSLIKGYAQVGIHHIFTKFDSMLNQGLKPDSITFTIVLNACSRLHMVDKSQKYLDMMSESQGIIPMLEHYACIADVLSRVGQFDNALDIILNLQSQVVWHHILRACNILGNSDLAKSAFQYAIQLNNMQCAVPNVQNL